MSSDQAGAIMALLWVGAWLLLFAGVVAGPRYRLSAWTAAAGCAAAAFVVLWVKGG